MNNLIIKNNGSLSDTFLKMQNIIAPDLCIEVGAHAAEFSNYMSKNFNINSIAFEAGKEIYEKYKDTTESLVSYVNCAISDTDGYATFFVHGPATLGNNGIKRVTFTKSVPVHKVVCYKLDTYMQKYQFENACLWIDAEGANKEVLLGARETLKKVSSIFIETEDSLIWKDQWLTKDVELYLKRFGFKKLLSEDVYANQKNIIFVNRNIVSHDWNAYMSTIDLDNTRGKLDV
jgi:FkbM family methyltransferase